MSTPSPFSAAEIASEGIKPEEYAEIVRRLDRHPNKAELGMFGVMWSEHCCYKNSRPLLKNFPTTGDRVLVGPGENAGVVDMGEGIRLAFKIESHNHPSAVEPFQGAATGVGGILRDIFTMGARPIAVLNSLRFGSLDDAKTRRLFSGVVSGISHYGNCLIGSETVIWRDRLGVHVDTIGNFVDSRIPEGQTTWELNDHEAVETLSVDPETNQSCWKRVRRLFKRQTNQIFHFKTTMGRELTVTADHPMMLWSHQAWDTRPAHTVKIGDSLPLLTKLPEISKEAEAIDLLAMLNPEERVGINVHLPETWQPTAVLRTALTAIETSPVKRHRYFSSGYFPLDLFLQLESLIAVDRSELTLTKRGKANYCKAVIQPDEGFARLLGYYLSEGCTSANGNTYKIIFTFAHHESEYVEDVKIQLSRLGLRPCVEVRKLTIAVYATSWLIGSALKKWWKCGDSAQDKAMPAFIFNWTSDLTRQIIVGLFRGDGSLTFPKNGSHAKVSYASTSRILFEQTLLLLHNLGIMPSVHVRPEQNCTIEGREYLRKPMWQLEVNNAAGLELMTGVFSEIRDRQLVTALEKYQGHRYSFPRFKQATDAISVVKVREIEVKEVNNLPVYDIEVDDTHLFVTSSGIVTHNCVGVPTIGGEVYFDRAYSGNPLVNAMALGLMETTEIVKSGAKGIGNPVLYVGSTTGRDGMGGASFASAELSAESIDDRPAVQVGDPFLEKSLIEACLEAFKTGAVVAAQDMGAAGLTCSTAEMAAKGGVGILLDLDKIPARETGMVPYEYLLSESQERMLFVAEKGREQELIDIFHKWELQAVVAGEVIAESIVRIMFKGEIAAELPATALSDDTPIYEHELMTTPPDYAQKAWAWKPESLPKATYTGIDGMSWKQVLLKLLDTPTIASKRWVYRQYDHQVQNNTVMLPGGADAAIVRVRALANETEKATFEHPATMRGVAATTDCNPRYVYLNPYEGAKMAVAEAARNLSCVGAEPIAVTDNLNFGSPEKPIGYWQLANACTGISEACREFNTPVTGGNVSLYNETLDDEGNPTPIYPTPVIGMVGIVEDISKAVGQGFRTEGDRIYLLGLPISAHADTISFGGSEYLMAIQNIAAGQPPVVDFALERSVQAACREGIRQSWIKSAHDSSEGGLAIALAESCIGGNIGASAELISESHCLDYAMFAEGGARIIATVSPENQTEWETYLNDSLQGNWECIGTVIGSALEIIVQEQTVMNVSVAEMTETWGEAIDRRMAV
jgi:phosphoribosylformylglycinamidine synthase II